MKNRETAAKRPSRTERQIDAMVCRLHDLRHPLEAKARTKGLNLHETEELRHIHAALDGLEMLEHLMRKHKELRF